MVNVESVTGGQFGLYGLPSPSLFGWRFSDSSVAFAVMLALAILVVTVCWLIGESPFGRILKGIREDEIAVRALGKNTWFAKAAVFGISAAIAGGTGAVAAFYHQFVSPSSFTIDTSIFVISLIVVGGSGNVLGAVVGATLFSALTPLLQNFPLLANDAIPWQGVIYGAALALIALARPQGIVPEGASFFGPKSLDQRNRVVRDTVSGSAAALGLRRRPSGVRKGEPILSVSRLNKSFGGLHAVNDVSFELHPGQITALIGPNGAGKTTLFNLVMAQLQPDSGRIVLRERDITGWPTYRIAREGMTRSFQDLRAFERLTVMDNVALGVPDQFGERISRLAAWPAVRRAERRTLDRAWTCLSFVGLEGLCDRTAGSLSFAEQKLMSFAQLLATEADVLLLDEPTAGVDVAAVEKVIAVVQALRASGAAVCIVEHSIHVVRELADNAIFLDQGTVLARGTIEELTAREDLGKVYFGG